MSLLARLRADQLASRRSKDEISTNLLTALIGEASRIGKDDGNRESTDDEVLATIKKFLKGAEETGAAIQARSDGSGPSQYGLQKINCELEILRSYQPAQATDDQIRAAIASYRESNPDANIGGVMGHLKATFGANYDGKRGSALAREALA
jgi:uncharacterized protein YqeY